jgi:ATP-dependent Lhr-like helicase
MAWPPILRGESTLVCSPTGSGKTLAAFLASIDRLAFGPPAPMPGIRVLYISPLRALAVDVEKNLRRPLAGIVEEARGDARTPTVGVRTGDTPQRERAAIKRKPPDILITTPESLFLMLSSQQREVLRHVETVIIDEIHQLVPTKRGAHLFLSLERLERLRVSQKPLQRIGLSATQKPLEVTARALVGTDRPVTIVDVGEKKPLKITVDAFDFAKGVDEDVEIAERDGKKSIWPEIHARILQLIRAHKSTIVFCNSRRLSERLAADIDELAGNEIALAHHGSIAREQRLIIEEKLKTGQIPCIVATSSLELGIDMGAVDLVIQIEAPPQVAAGIQRIGRASHHVGGIPAGVILSKHRGDLLACSAAAEGILAGDVEAVAWPKNPLDVLAQQIVATCLEMPVRVNDMLALVRRAAPFSDLPDSAYMGVLEMLSGRYPSHAFSGLRARITWDRNEGMLAAREGASTVVIANAGTIPDRGLYAVYWEQGTKSIRVGELDEEMVFESREGDVFLLGATAWRIERITPERVIVTPAPGEEARMPFWRGDGPGRARPFGLRVGALARELAESAKEKTPQLQAIGLTQKAVTELTSYVLEQKSVTEDVPSDRTIVIERFEDGADLRVVILTPLGARVHAPWALAVTQRLIDAGHGAPDVIYTDDGIAFRIAEGDAPPDVDLFLPDEAELDTLLANGLPGSQLFASRFRECAARALLLPRRRIGKRTPLWAQRKRSTDLLAVASQYPDFPMLLETMRECLADAFDVDGLKTVLRDIESGAVKVRVVDTPQPSPFAKTVIFSFIGAFLYDEDMPAPERRAQALQLDHAQLQELLGEADLRSLLEPDVIDAHERFLQRIDLKASSVDGLHDLLLSLGDLSRKEISDRFDGDHAAALQTLLSARRVFETTIAGETRIVASEDASRVRDGLGAVVPKDLPADLLEAVREPLGDLVLRFARTHGPFTTEDAVKRFGVDVTSDLQALAQRGVIRQGAYRPEGTDREWCGADVLGALRGRTLAALRRASAPAPREALARFALAWHGVTRPDTLEHAIEKLEGLPIGIGILEDDVLPARVRGYRKADLDGMIAMGRIAWVALDAPASRDLRIVLASSEREAELLPPPGHAPGDDAEAVRTFLEKRGASFSHEIVKALGRFGPDIGRALWDLMFHQEVSNDTLDAARVVFGGSTGRIHEGRWFLRKPRLERTVTPTEMVAARTRALLARHGVLTREAAVAEGVEGGFSRIYPVLRAMEDAGRIQRGLFAEGTSGLQFALPAALTLLRASKESKDTRGVVLAATDPANLWGSVFSWPEHELRVTRSLGARVVLVDGALAAWIPPNGESLMTWPLPGNKGDEDVLARTLANDLEPNGRVFFTAIDGKPPREHPLASALRRVGFFPFGPGLARGNKE